jgi:hypothetical protein
VLFLLDVLRYLGVWEQKKDKETGGVVNHKNIKSKVLYLVFRFRPAYP